jgi:hypothetical protein
LTGREQLQYVILTRDPRRIGGTKGAKVSLGSDWRTYVLTTIAISKTTNPSAVILIVIPTNTLWLDFKSVGVVGVTVRVVEVGVGFGPRDAQTTLVARTHGRCQL